MVFVLRLRRGVNKRKPLAVVQRFPRSARRNRFGAYRGVHSCPRMIFLSGVRNCLAYPFLYFPVEERVVEVVRFRRSRIVNDDSRPRGTRPDNGDHNFLKTDVCSHIENLQMPLTSTNGSVVCSQQRFACERRELYSVTRHQELWKPVRRHVPGARTPWGHRRGCRFSFVAAQ
jgi:hypothetical protein